MSVKTVRAEGNDLATVLGSAAAELLDQDHVEVVVTLPDDIVLSKINVELAGLVTVTGSEDGEAPAAESDKDDRGKGRDRDADRERDRDAGDEDLDEDDLASLDEEADAAADFVEGILDAMDLDGELKIHVNEEDGRAEVEVVDMDSGALIGRRGSTLEAVQELLRCAMQSQFQRRVRVSVDVEGYRSRRLEKLLEKADDAIDAVLDTGEPERLEPMDVFERKSVHERVGEVEGVTSRSQGREPSRRVIIEAE